MKAKIELLGAASLRRGNGRVYKRGKPIISTDLEEIRYAQGSSDFRVIVLKQIGRPPEKRAVLPGAPPSEPPELEALPSAPEQPRRGYRSRIKPKVKAKSTGEE